MAQPALKQKVAVPKETEQETTPLREGKVLQVKPLRKTRTFHATVLVTRVEEWTVEAASAEAARELLQNGDGHRSQIGECLHFEIEKLAD